MTAPLIRARMALTGESWHDARRRVRQSEWPTGRLMTTVCCYTRLHPAAAASLPEGTIRADVSADPLEYWRVLWSLWGRRADLLVIEHDIEVHDGVLPSLAACARDWCTFPYLQQPGLNFTCTQALGCTRFSAALQRAVRFPPVTRWESLDGAIATYLLAAGMTAHVHQPPVTHHRS